MADPVKPAPLVDVVMYNLLGDDWKTTIQGWLSFMALNGLAIGLGVLYPNLKEANPNKIVSGFGGTLCFVLSSFYILASVLLLMFGAAGLHARASWAAESPW